jgi:hypothetical protein
MDVIILIFFVLLIATLLLGIWQIKNPKLKTADDLSDDLCLYCPLDDDEKGTHGVPNGYISCEGVVAKKRMKCILRNGRNNKLYGKYNNKRN